MDSVFFVKITRLVLLVFLMMLVPVIISAPQRVFGDTVSHSPILISGNDGFTSDNGVTGGTGSSDDPYVIGGWTISAENYGIQISGTTAYFTIANVAISCDPTNANCWGIMLSSIENGVVQNSHLSGPKGIGVHNSDNFQITDNNLSLVRLAWPLGLKQL